MAWRALKWMLDSGDDALLDAASEQLAISAERHFARPFVSGNPEVLDHGMLTGTVRNEIHRVAFEEVVMPCAKALGMRCPTLTV